MKGAKASLYFILSKNAISKNCLGLSLDKRYGLPAEVAIRVWLHIFGQISASAAPVAIGDAEPLQLRSRFSDALASTG